MKSANVRRVVWSWWRLSVGGAAAFACFAACGGADESHTSRRGGEAGESAEPEAGAPGSAAGASSNQGGAGGLDGKAGAPIGGATDGGSDVGSGGVADEAGAAGQSAGGASEAGAGGQGGDGTNEPVVDPVCGLGRAQVGAVSEWCGKVNVHLVGTSWVTDTDCTSGCRNDDAERLAYCKKFYPTSASIVKVNQVASGTKDWKNAGCNDSFPDGPGISGEFACCAPVP